MSGRPREAEIARLDAHTASKPTSSATKADSASCAPATRTTPGADNRRRNRPALLSCCMLDSLALPGRRGGGSVGFGSPQARDDHAAFRRPDGSRISGVDPELSTDDAERKCAVT